MTNKVTLRAMGMVKSTGKWEKIGETSVRHEDLENPADDLVEVVTELKEGLDRMTTYAIKNPDSNLVVTAGDAMFDPRNFLATRFDIIEHND